MPHVSLDQIEKVAAFFALAVLVLAATALSEIGRSIIISSATRFIKSRFGETLKSIPIIGAGLGLTNDLIANAPERSSEAGYGDGVARPRYQLAKQQVLKRLNEAASIRSKRAILARVFTGVAGSLTFAQYIIGGILGSSFFQQKTPPNIIGASGLFVLVASLLTHHYHPDVSGQNNSVAATKLNALIRRTEDRMVVIEAQLDDGDDPKLMLELLEKLTAEINEITSPSQPVVKSKGR
jgi:hypothetical protein